MTAYTVPFNYFCRVDLSVRTYNRAGDFNTTATYSFTSKSLKDSSSVITYWPLLTQIGEITLAAGEFIPSVSFSSFTIRNEAGTFGLNRKFGDVLERYSPIEQDVAVYVAAVSTDSDAVSSWTQIAKGFCSSWSMSCGEDGDTITFDVRTARISENLMLTEVSTNKTGMSAAPDSSLGRAIPLIIGQYQNAIPIRVSADGATTGSWMCGSGYAGLFGAGPKLTSVLPISAYTKNYDDEWEVFADQSTASPTSPTTGTRTATTALSVYDVHAYKITLTTSILATQVKLDMDGLGTGGRVSTARLDVWIMRVDNTTFDVLEEKMAQGSVSLATYDASNNAGGNFYVTVSLDRPAFLAIGDGSYDYYVALQCRGWKANEMALWNTNVNTTALVQSATAANAGETNGQNSYQVTTTVLKMPSLDILGVNPDWDYGSPGVFTLAHTASPDSGQENCNFDNLPVLIGDVHGLTDDIDGVAQIVEPSALIQYLLYTKDTVGAWSDPGNWYHSASSKTVTGVVDQQITVVQLITEICRATAARVGIRADGKMFYRAWGTAGTTYDIPTEDITPLSWEARPIDTVVNSAVVKTKKTYLTPPASFQNPTSEARDGFTYSEVVDYNLENVASYPGALPETIASRRLYGLRPASGTEFTLYGGTNAGQTLAQYLVTRYGKPLVYASFIVPWYKYQSVQMFDVVRFAHPKFPAFYGTNPEATDAVVVSGTTTVTVNSALGYELVNAETYRGLVESLTYFMPLGHAPTIKITVLVLLNYPLDPT